METTRWKICAFTKPFQSLGYEEMAERMAEAGFDGVEATIREGGHIEPERVPDELPRMVEALERHGLELTIMASSINEANDRTERQLQTAAAVNVKRYRMAYYRYDRGRPLVEQLEEYRSKVRDLAAMNHQFGITGLYQNHAGADLVGAPVWDLRYLLDGVAADRAGVAFDIRHATVDGGTAWPLHFRVVRDWLGIVYVKDFAWREGERGPVNVPLGEGRVDRRFFSMLAESGYGGPISLHEEYIDHRDPALVPEHVAALRRDLERLRGWLGEGG